MSTPPIIAGGPTAASPLSSESTTLDTTIEAIMMARYDALKDLVEKQADTIQARNEQLRALGNEKAELASKGIPSSEDQKRLEALDVQIASMTNMQTVEMVKLQDLVAKMNQSQEMANAIARKFNDIGTDLSTRIR